MKGFKIPTPLLDETMEKQKSSDQLIGVIKQLAIQNKEHEKCEDDLEIANKELTLEKEANEKCAEELMIANNELAAQNKENENSAEELITANKELVSQNDEKEKQEQSAEDMLAIIARKEREQTKRILDLSEMIKKDIFSPEELQTKVGYIKQFAFDLENSIKELSDLLQKYLSPDEEGEGSLS
jgi:hypothetical protein